jgi:hypothetical protein
VTAALVAVLVAFQPVPTPTEITDAAAHLTATATVGATRTGNTVQLEPTLPPPPVQEDIGFSSDSYNGRCVGAEGLLALYSPGWNVTRMSGIMYRESRCDPSAKNSRSSATGLLQLLSSLHCPWLAKTLGPCDLYDPDYNIRAGALLWEKSGYGAWSTS